MLTNRKILYEEFKSDAKFIEIKENQCLLFSPTILHGNTINNTNSTRISINCRFKSMFSPEIDKFPSERVTGPFYKPLNYSPLTRIALEYSDEDIFFTEHCC